MSNQDVYIQLLSDLKRNGCEVDNVHDFYTIDSKLDNNSVDILLHWLPKLTNSDIDNKYKTAICSFIHREHRPNVDINVFLKTFENEANDVIRWGYANVINKYAVKKDVHKLLNIVRHNEYGSSRQLLVTALGKQKMKTEETTDTLISLLDDEDVFAHAIDSLGRLKETRAISHINRFLSHDIKEVRKVAAKALSKIAVSN